MEMNTNMRQKKKKMLENKIIKKKKQKKNEKNDSATTTTTNINNNNNSNQIQTSNILVAQTNTQNDNAFNTSFNTSSYKINLII